MYVSRSAYTGQFAGSHDWIRSGAKFDWNAAYSYSNRRQPDRPGSVEREKNPENGIYEYSIDQGAYRATLPRSTSTSLRPERT